jgi:transposase
LLLSDGGRPGGRLTRDQIAAALGMHVNTVDRIRKRFVTEGEVPATDRKPRLTPPTPPKLDGRAEAVLVAICCGPAPEGRTRWTLRLLADELARRRVVTSVCVETVRLRLKKTTCSPGGSGAGACPSATTPGSSPRWNKSSTPTRRPRTPTSR